MKNLFVLSLILISFGTTPLWAKGTATVIMTRGDVQAKVSSGSGWKPVTKGTKLETGSQIKTGSGASALVLTPRGTLARFQGNQESTYPFEGSGADTSRWKTVVTVLGGQEGRKRVAATRALGKSDQKLWLIMMQDRITIDNMDQIFRLSAVLQEDRKMNRSIALLWKASYDLPDHDGFRQLFKKARKSYKNEFKLKIFKKVNGKVSKMQGGDTLYAGSGIQAKFQPKDESYFYLFLTSQPQGKAMETSLVFPKELEATKIIRGEQYYASRIAGKSKITLPGKNNFYKLDDSIGYEHLWGWICLGPIVDSKIMEKTIAAVERTLQNETKLSIKVISKTKPKVCSVFTLSVKHQ